MSRSATERPCAARPVQEVPRVTRTEFVSRQEGQTMAEYAVVLGVITPLLVIALAALSDSVAERLNAVVGFLS
jgi:Flp pilus assembly pilin Flp